MAVTLNLARSSSSRMQTSSLPLFCHFTVVISDAVPRGHFRVLRDFCERWRYDPRNSYRSLKCLLYETVNLNQIEK
jgi:hypothetical protein